MVFGYTSSHNDKMLTSEDPLIQLIAYGCNEVIEEQQHNAPNNPMLEKLIKDLKCGDTLIITALEEIGSNLNECYLTIKNLVERDITVNIMNIGIFDNSVNGKMLLNQFSISIALRQFEKKHSASSEVAATTTTRKRARKYTDSKIENALSLLKVFGGEFSYSQVELETGISKSTLLREVTRRRAINDK